MSQRFTYGVRITGDSTQAVRAMRTTDREMDRLRRGVRQTDRRIDASRRGFQRWASSMLNMRSVLGPLIGITGAAGLGRLVTSTMDATAAISENADIAGISAERYQELVKAFGDLGGVSDEVSAGALRRFNRRLDLARDGTGAAVATLEKMNISLAQDTPAALDEAIGKLLEMGETQSIVGEASQLFGEDAGPRLAAVLAQGTEAMERQIETIREQGRVLDNDLIANTRGARDSLNEMKDALGTEFTRLIIDNTEQIQMLGTAIMTAGQWALWAVDGFSQLAEAGSDVVDRMTSDSLGRRLEQQQNALDALLEQREMLTGMDRSRDPSGFDQQLERINDQISDTSERIKDLITQRQELISPDSGGGTIDGGRLDPIVISDSADEVSGLSDEIRDLLSLPLPDLTFSDTLLPSIDQLMERLPALREEWQATARETLGSIDPVTRAVQQYSEQLGKLEDVQRTLGLSDEDYLRVRQRIREEYEQNIERAYGLADATDEVTRATQEAAQEPSLFATEWERALEGIQGGFADVFYDAMEDGISNVRDGLDVIQDAFRRMLAEMAAAAVMNPIRVAFEGSGSLGSGGGGFGFGDIGAGFSNVANTFSKSGIGQSLGLSQQVGHPTGGVSTELTAVGSSLGSVAPLIPIGIAANELFGNVVWDALDDAFGGRRDSEWFRLISGARPGSAAADPLGNVRGETGVGRAFDQRDLDRSPLASAVSPFGRLSISGETDLAGDAQGRATKMIQAFASIDQQLAQALGEDLVTQIVDDGILEGVLIASEKTFSDDEGSSQRAVTDVIRERIALILSGVNEAAASAVRNFEPGSEDPERLARFGTAVSSLTGFTESSMALPEQQSLVDLYREQGDAVRSLIDSYDGSLAATEQLAAATQQTRQMELQLLDQIRTASEAVDNTLGSTIEMIERDLMTDKQEYNFLREQAEQIAAGLSDITDPARLQQEVERIDALTRDAYGLLDETQRESMGQGFLDFLTGVDEIAKEQLDDLRSDVEGSGKSLRDEVSGVITDLADRLSDAADKQQRAADIMLEAANTPQRVQITGAPTGPQFAEVAYR